MRCDEVQAEIYQQCRPQLVTYVTRLVAREDVAEEIAQDAVIRLLESEHAQLDDVAARAWLFRTATNLAIDHLRRHSTWREEILIDARTRAIADESFLAASRSLRGQPEMASIAHEHLSVCFSCTLRNLPSSQAAALLLKEVYGFTIEETAEMLDASAGQIKNWVQVARASLRAKYESTCALITKGGVCFQCSELSEFFNGRPANPLAGSESHLEARLAILRERQAAQLGPWHRMMMKLVDELLSGR